MAFVPYHDDRGLITFGGEPYQRVAATAATLSTGTPPPRRRRQGGHRSTARGRRFSPEKAVCSFGATRPFYGQRRQTRKDRVKARIYFDKNFIQKNSKKYPMCGGLNSKQLIAAAAASR